MTPEQFKRYRGIKEETLKIEEQIIQNLRDAGKMNSRENVDLIEIRGNNIHIETSTYRNGEYDSYEYTYPYDVVSDPWDIREYDNEKDRLKLLEDIKRKMEEEEKRLREVEEEKIRNIEREKKLYEELKKKYGNPS